MKIMGERSLSKNNKVKELKTKREYGAWWATRKKLEGADEIAAILVAVRPDPPQEREDSKRRVRQELLSRYQDLVGEGTCSSCKH